MSASNAKTALATARLWHHIDAKGLTLGRLASGIARVLQGKHKPIYHPCSDVGDYVVVTNAKDIYLSGRALDQKVYYHHTGYPGGLKKTFVKDLLASKPQDVILKAVRGMLPKNRTRDLRMSRLLVFPGPHHPYEANIYKNYITPEFQPFASVIHPLRPIGIPE